MENPNRCFLERVRQTAEQELSNEAFERAVEREKIRLKQHVPFWNRLFPFVITITRRNK